MNNTNNRNQMVCSKRRVLDRETLAQVQEDHPTLLVDFAMNVH